MPIAADRQACCCRQVEVGELLGDAPEGWVPPQTVLRLQRMNLHKGQRLARAKLREQETRELEGEFDEGSPSGASFEGIPSSR